MKRTILLDAFKGETRLVVLEDGRLCEMYIERPNSDEVAGSIYLGRVQNVLPGMNAAFVDIGAEKNGFLPAGNITIDTKGDPALADSLAGLRIEKLARPGQTILVQATKAPYGDKGARLSCHIALPGRTLVLLPNVRYAGVSRKIADSDERNRLHGIARALTHNTDYGLIVRTAAKGLSEDALNEERDALLSLWGQIQRRAEHAAKPGKLYSNDDLSLRCARDMLSDDTEAVWIEDEALFQSVTRLASQWKDNIQLHKGDTPLFDLYRVDSQLEKALSRVIRLKSGGTLVIDETEAMTVIDVNTGKFTGKKTLLDTIFRLNMEAAEEIARLLRLRDAGGIIIVDFIDMDDPAQNEALLSKMRELAKADRSRLTVVGMTSLGLVEMTRKKSRRSLSGILNHVCSECNGTGYAPSHETTARRILREVWRRRRMGEANPILIETSAPVAGWLMTLGGIEGGKIYACAVESGKAGEYRISPADEAHLPERCKLLK